jgi:hypothetical protein
MLDFAETAFTLLFVKFLLEAVKIRNEKATAGVAFSIIVFKKLIT